MAWTHALELNPLLASALDPARVNGDHVHMYDPDVQIVPGVICTQTVRHYLNGQCALFALCLQACIPGSLIALVHEVHSAADWVHTLVRLPNGQLADIRGIADEAAELRRWDRISGSLDRYAITTMPSRDAIEPVIGTLADADSMDLHVAIVCARMIHQLLHDRDQ